MTDAEKKKVKLANKEMSVRDIKRVAEGALTRTEAEERTKKYYENQNKKSPKATNFESWYEKNKDKYKSRARALEAYKMGPGKTESTRYGNSKGSLQKKKKGYAKGGMTDYRKKGMFYGGGMTRRGKR